MLGVEYFECFEWRGGREALASVWREGGSVTVTAGRSVGALNTGGRSVATLNTDMKLVVNPRYQNVSVLRKSENKETFVYVSF